VNAFLDRISGVFDKGLLLAGLFPLLITISLWTVLVATIFGWHASFFWLGSLSASTTATLTTALSVLLLVLSFLLRNLRRPLLSLWSGAGAPEWLVQQQLRRRAKLQGEITALGNWRDATDLIEAIVVQPRPGNVIPPERLTALNTAINQVVNFQSEWRTIFNQTAEQLKDAAANFDRALLIPLQERLKNFARSRKDWKGATVLIKAIVVKPRPGTVIPPERLTALDTAINRVVNFEWRTIFNQTAAQLRDAAENFDGALLIPLRQRLQNFAMLREHRETIPRQTLENRLALEYGPSEITEATRLGNTLLALDNYPYKRYWMEGSVFWPHIEQMMSGGLLDDIQNQRILLDFVLALASALLLSAVVALLIGPWIWLHPVWIFVSAVEVGLSYLVYCVFSLFAAEALSRALRAGCDLYRQDLLLALGVKVPQNLDRERMRWRQLSQLVIYGETGGLRFRDRPPQS